MSPMLTMVGHFRQDNIIYKCTQLPDHSSSRIMRYSLRPRMQYFWTFQGEMHPP